MSSQDIAIIGMACRVAGADSPSQLWQVLEESRDVRSEISRFNSRGFYRPDGGPRKGLTNVRHAYVMDHDLGHFDNTFFKISPLEAEAMDPQQRLLLEVTYETIENAGIPLEKFEGSDTAVYAGIFGNDYHASVLRDIDATPKYMSTGTSNSIAANRISYVFDLHGPSLVIDTACSSTIVALHYAIAALKAGDAKMALVCGANLIISPDMFVHMSELGFLSPSGRCQSFDAAGDGYVRGEGVMAILLKPLNDAVRDGDAVRAVIRGTKVNQDGRTQGISLPSSEAQRQNVAALYRQLGLSPGDIQYLEAHGTGTAVGDPLEMAAVEAVFGASHADQKLMVGSVKSNVGHLESCAALIGIIKTVEALERARIPPQMHFRTPNPKINFEHIAIPTEVCNWPATPDGVRRAGVNSFGFGGTNGHAVLESFPMAADHRVTDIDGDKRRPRLFKVSAASSASLEKLSQAYADYIDCRRPPLQQLAYTLTARRSSLRKMKFLTAYTLAELVDKLREADGKEHTKSSSAITKIAFIFTGQGAQWPEMGKELLQTSNLFRAVITACDQVLHTLPDRPTWHIADELMKPKETSHVGRASFSQPLCTALQIGLVELWRSWGVQPAAVCGHSSGEVAAAYTAGLISLEEAMIIAFYRGLYLGENAPVPSNGPPGGMCAIGQGEHESLKHCNQHSGRLALAAVNSGSSCTLSGDADAVEEVVKACTANGTFCRKLRVDMAYHSHHMLPLAPFYGKAMRAAGIDSPRERRQVCDMFSSVTRRNLAPEECTSTYWVDNMVSTVRFADALIELATNVEPDAFLEVGAHPALRGPAGDVLASLGKSNLRYFSSCSRGKPDHVALLESVGEMIAAGVTVDVCRVNSVESVNVEHDDLFHCSYPAERILTDLPTYQWDHQTSFWGESRISRNVRFREFPRHELLGARQANDMPRAPIWRNLLTVNEIKWLSTLTEEQPEIVSPTVFILMAAEAARQLQVSHGTDSTSLQLQNLSFHHPFPLQSIVNGQIETQFRAATADGFAWKFEIFSAADSESWDHNCTGVIALSHDVINRPCIGEVVHDEGRLEYIQSFGILKTSNFDTFSLSKSSATGHVASHNSHSDEYLIEPSLFALGIQLPMALLLGSDLPAAYDLISLDVLELPVGTCKADRFSVSSQLSSRQLASAKADLIIEADSEPTIVASGLRLRRREFVERDPCLKSLFFSREFVPDITFLNGTEPLSISNLLRLTTGKWPMSDIGIFRLCSIDVDVICSHLHGVKSHQRPRFRSLHVLGDIQPPVSNRVRQYSPSDPSTRFHLVVGPAKTLRLALSAQPRTELVCMRLEDDDDKSFFQDRFETICQVTGFHDDGWVLGRAPTPTNGVVQPSRLKIFTASKPQTMVVPHSGVLDIINLAETPLDMVREAASKTVPFDAIILDSADRPILTGCRASEFLPWLQILPENTGIMLWVSVQHSLDPHNNVAGGFLKTIQSEYPSMKVANLLFRDENDSKFIMDTVYRIYDRLVHGEKELEFAVLDRQVHILRYYADDDLAASVGLIPPITSTFTVSSDHEKTSYRYRVGLECPGNTVLLAERPNIGQPLESSDLASVRVQASVLDCSDAVAFRVGEAKDGEELGGFFAAVVESSLHPALRPGTPVVGWQPGALQTKLQVPLSQLYPYPPNVTASDAAVQCAAYATALAVVHGQARTRPGDKLQVNVGGVLQDAFVTVCDILGATAITGTTESQRENVGFVVDFDATRGILLNGQDVSVGQYMRTNPMSTLAQRGLLLGIKSTPSSPIIPFQLVQHQEAFGHAVRGPCSAVILHYDLPEMATRSKCVKMTYKPGPAPLFHADGAYVMVGGSGGLGQYLTRWMVQRGAKNIFLLSRSGPDSVGISALIEDVGRKGAHLGIIKVDATESTAVRHALECIRRTMPIRGCLNLAMVLEDAAISTMSVEQWDKAVRIKVDSAWNLHAQTSEDRLDFFIMFSSITSIRGNRTQANYATGNAFLNSLAEYRHAKGLPATAIALGAISGIGVLASNDQLVRQLRQSGLDIVDAAGLEKVMEAAVRCPDRAVITVGLQMFENIDGQIQAKPEQTQLYWTDWPEFGFLIDHKLQNAGVTDDNISLLERLQQLQPDKAGGVLFKAFAGCLRDITGQEETAFDLLSPLSMYGLDSLNAVGVRYWFFKQIGVDVPVFDILGCKTIQDLIQRVCLKLHTQVSSNSEQVEKMPEPVHHVEISKRPLSHSQKRLWFMHQFLSDKTVYNLLLVCHIEGHVNQTIFQNAWTLFTRRHEVLRSRVVETSDGLQQIPVHDFQFPLTTVSVPDEDFDYQEQQLILGARSHHFDLESGDLVRGWLLQSPSHTRFLLASHHLAWDRASSPTIFSETSAIYKSLLAGDPAEALLTPVSYQFIDYTLWQNDWLSREGVVKPLLDYWKTKLQGIPEAVSLLPFAHVDRRPAVKEYAVGQVQSRFTAALSASLKTFCSHSAVTPFMFLTSALSALVCRLTGDEDIVIGITNGDRGNPAFDQLVGFTVNMLAIRSRVNGHQPYQSLLEDFRTTCLEAYEHGAIPFDYLLQNLDICRRTSQSPVFQITVNYQMQGSFPECDYGDFKFTAYDHYNARTQSDISLEIEETSDGELLCNWEFDTSLYDESSISELSLIYRTFIEDIVAKGGNGTVDEFQIVPGNDQDAIASYLQPLYETEKSLMELDADLFPSLFERCMAEVPDKVAVMDGMHSFTYAQLDEKANAVASRLIHDGAKVGDRIGLCCEQTSDMVVGVYGILKAGCAYVPMDPDFPAERMAWMIEDTGTHMVLVDSVSNHCRQRLLSCGLAPSSLYDVSQLISDLAHTKPPSLRRAVTPKDPFCCIFTSGSTGRPKGIYISHGALRYQMHGYHKYIGTTREDVVLLATAMVFDLSLTAIFGVIQHGATMFVASRKARYSPTDMVDTLLTNNITSCIFTPTQFKMLLRADNRHMLPTWKCLRSLVLGGESIPPWLVQEFFGLDLPQARLFNGYAPAETTVVNSLKELSRDDATRHAIPVNGPCYPARFHILDEHRRPVPFGVPGELYIGGPTVNESYVQRPEATAKAFFADPFAPPSEVAAGFGRLYRTGDLFCLSRDGTVRSLGRIGSDRQVKIRGMRVELEEIENSITAAYAGLDDEYGPKVHLVVVTYHRTTEVDGVLTAYLETDKGVQIPESQQRDLTAYFRLTLKAILPVHMLPAVYAFVPDLPRTVSGKVDYRAIGSWSPPTPNSLGDEASPSEPLSQIEAQIVSVWKEVLQLSTAGIIGTDDFFSLGGHSLALPQVQKRIEEICGVSISLAEMFANSTPRELGSLVSRLQQSDSASRVNGFSEVPLKKDSQDAIDWDKEISLPGGEDAWNIPDSPIIHPSAIIVTGATGMVGTHFVHLLLMKTEIKIHCIGIEARTDEQARDRVLSAFSDWKLLDKITDSIDPERLIVYRGSLSLPKFGLSGDAIDFLDRRTQAIYHFDSDVSLFKKYAHLRASNIGSLRFLIDLARGMAGPVKQLHYLSSWGVPHLQSWHTTKNYSSRYETGEVELTNMQPGRESTLGYLKCRWVSEAILYETARRGLPVTIYRGCMVASTQVAKRGVDRTDINRRILAAAISTGMVPDFRSDQGGGMSWISVDYLVKAIHYFSLSALNPNAQHITGRRCRILNFQPERHVLYRDLAAILQTGHGGRPLKTVSPTQWFEALRASGSAEMIMQADVLEQWYLAGWTPFPLQGQDTSDLLVREAGLVVPTVDRSFLLEQVVGDLEF